MKENVFACVATLLANANYSGHGCSTTRADTATDSTTDSYDDNDRSGLRHC